MRHAFKCVLDPATTVNWLRNSLALTVGFLAALLLSACGLFVLVDYLSQPQDSGTDYLPILFICWGFAQLLLIGTSIVSFRSGMRQRQAEQALQQVAQLQSSILDSAGPMMIATDLQGNILVFNPAAERMLGYRETELVGKARVERLFPEGEMERVGQRLVDSLNRIGNTEPKRENRTVLDNYVEYVSSFPVSRVRGFETQYRRKDGSTFPAMVYLSAVRNPEGAPTGLLAISTDLSATKRAERALRESEERYRDLFENSNEMIATLSPRGRYLYVNPAWQMHFGQTADAFETLMSFESAFPPEIQAEAAALFRRALNGETIERASLRMPGIDGSVTEMEAGLSCRREDGRPVSVRCIFRDVTQQNRRERRLAMQLIVSQIVGESTTPEQALPKVLEALGTSLGCEMANLWVVDEDQRHMTCRISWSTPGRPYEEFRRDCIGRLYTRGQGLVGGIWALGSPRWIEDVREDPTFQRRQAARLDGLVAGWGVPVRVGNQVTAVVEFFARQRQQQDREIMATVETVCASLGQFMARSAQESRVRELNRQKEFILNSVADGIFGTDPRGTVIFVNPAAAFMLGSTAQNLVGRMVHSIVHEERKDGLSCTENCRTRRAFSIHEATSGQDVFFRRGGASFPVEFSVTPIVERGAVVGSVMSFRDISQRYALDRMKDEFVSTVSHELRTPLTSIRGALGLLSAGLLGEVSEKAANLLRIAVSNSDRLVRLINDILDLERMQSGRAPLSLRRCALNELAQQAIDTLHPVADAARVTLLLDAGPTYVDADSDRVLQVMTNLLSNAVKFSPPDSMVQLQLRSDTNGVTLNVIDEGRGVPADKLETIFDRFQQVDASDSRQKGGTGLGLAICRTIVQQHGGRIWAERNADRGTTFRMFLPMRINHEGAEAAGLLLTEGISGGTVLVCDDDEHARRSLAESLHRHSYHVIEAESGAQAIAFAHQFPINAILLALSLPHMEGWETLKALKEDEATAGIPVVVLSMPLAGTLPTDASHANGWVGQANNDDLVLRELARVLGSASEQPVVLVVEDDEELASVILSTFDRAGIQAFHASTGRRAIELCQTMHPDLIVLDLALPEGDGFQIVDWLRQHQQLRKLPLVVYSAREVSSDERQQLELGPTEYLTKATVPPQQVQSLVAAMLRKYRGSNELSASSDQTHPGQA